MTGYFQKDLKGSGALSQRSRSSEARRKNLGLAVRPRSHIDEFQGLSIGRYEAAEK